MSTYLRTPGAVEVGGKVTGGHAASVSATGRHIVLLMGGSGVRPNGWAQSPFFAAAIAS